MQWWVITDIQTACYPDSIFLEWFTNLLSHHFVTWSYFKPMRVPIYRTVRGTIKFCGWKYIWASPHIEEQTQLGGSLEHSLTIPNLKSKSKIWLYMHSPLAPPPQQCQSPLQYYYTTDLWEAPLKTCKLYRAASLALPPNTAVAIPWDTVLWDTANFFNAANPTYITIPEAGLYQLDAALNINDGNHTSFFAWIVDHDGNYHAQNQYQKPGISMGFASFTLGAKASLNAGQRLYLKARQNGTDTPDLTSVQYFAQTISATRLGPKP